MRVGAVCGVPHASQLVSEPPQPAFRVCGMAVLMGVAGIRSPPPLDKQMAVLGRMHAIPTSPLALRSTYLSSDAGDDANMFHPKLRNQASGGCAALAEAHLTILAHWLRWQPVRLRPPQSGEGMPRANREEMSPEVRRRSSQQPRG